MRSILAVAVAVAVVGCGGTPPTDGAAEAPEGVSSAPIPAAPAAPAFAPSWRFTARDVSGSFTVTQQPDGRDLVSLIGTATVGGLSGTVNGTEVPSNGIFRVYIQLGARQVQVDGQIDATGAAFSGHVNDTAGFPALGGLTQYSETVTGTSP